MTTPQSALLISDACVLIDYCKAGCHDILAIVSTRFLPIRVPRRILDEVDQLSEEDVERLGIGVLDVTYLQLQEAAVRGGPSQQDRLCFVVARDHGGAVWSNDKKLRALCREHGVRQFWGLEILLVLVIGKHLDKKRAREAAANIHAVDPHYVTRSVLGEFMEKLDRL